MSAQAFWIVSVPGIPSQEIAFQQLKETAEKIKGCSASKFYVPAIRGGAFDYLIRATEEIPKLETESESLAGRLGMNLATVLEKPSVDESDALVEETSLKDYLLTFKWDPTKYPVDQSLDTIFALISKQLKHIEILRDSKVRKYMLVYELLGRCEKRRQGPLTTRNYLGDVVTEEDFIIDSKFLKTLLVAVPRPMTELWDFSYERMHEEIVPRSSKIICEEDDYVLYSIVAFGRCERELREIAKKRGFFVREYDYKQNEMFEFNQEISILYTEKTRMQIPLITWLKMQFGEICSAYIHLKAIKVHIESLLRYGPADKYQAAVLSMEENLSRKVTLALYHKYEDPEEIGVKSAKKKSNKPLTQYEEMADLSEYHPYVFTKVKVTIGELARK